MVQSISGMAIAGMAPGADASLNDVKGGARNDEKIKDAARQFEALLISQMLKGMRDSEGGWMGTEDESASSAMEYGQEMFAQSLSASGGLGLANLVVAGLKSIDEP